MSVFNRILIVIAALVIFAGAVITLFVACGVSTAQILPYAWAQSILQHVADASGGALASIIVISVIVAVAMIGLLSIEIAPSHKAVSLVISSTYEGVTTIDLDSICVLAEHVGVAIHGIRDVKSSVKENPEGLLVDCRASADLGSSILEIEPELRSRVKTAIEQLTGLHVAVVDIRVKYGSKKAKRLAVS